ncbi:MAG TPA: maleylpyruvate isomerase family mycothiol-dependent enzyme [Streptosporangiaceae bacterium]
MTLTTTDVRAIPPIRHDEAMELAAAEYQRFTALLGSLAPGDWNASTVCDRWDVRAMTAHVLGAAEACASLRENMHQMRLGRRVQRQLGLGHIVHGANEVQIRERAGLGPAELIDRWASAVPRALRGRRRFPPFLRPVRISFEPPLGKRSLAYLMDIVYTRDVWMHRLDIARATGHQPILTAGHDGRIVADMVADWAGTHHHAFSLRLTGPAGGSYTSGSTGPALDIDAIEWAWTISGRAPGTGLLALSLPL